MPLANFPKGFSGGLTIQGMPIAVLFSTSQASLGNTAKTGVYWVDSANGLDGNNGTYQLPLKTIGRAWALVSANDVIVLKPGHTDVVSSATAANGGWNVAGVTVVGLGVGSQRPNITLDTANTSTITVSAANIAVQNVVFTANFLAIAKCFTITTAKGFTVDNCDFVDTSSVLNFLDIFSTNATANAADKLQVTNNKFYLLATSGVVRLYAAGAATDHVTIQNNVWNTPSTNAAAVLALGANAHTNLLVTGNLFNATNTAATATGVIITSSTTITGWFDGNKCFTAANASGTTNLLITAGSGIRYGLNYVSDTADTSPYVLPALDT